MTEQHTHEATAQSHVDGRPRLAKDKLGVIAVAFFVFAAAAPIAALAGATPLIFSGVGPGAPVIILIAAVLIAIFAVGYLQMGKRIQNAGGFVVLVSHGLGRAGAGIASGVVIATYIGLSVGLWSLFGLFAEGMFAGWGIPIPAVVWSIIGALIGMFFVLRGAGVSVGVLIVLISLEFLAIVTLVIGIFVTTPIGEFASPALSVESVMSPGIGIAFLFALAMFTMFEAPTVFSEEAKNPSKTIPRALFLSVTVIGLLYAVSTWAISAVVGNESIVEAASTDPDGLVFGIAATVIGGWFSEALLILVVVSFLAMMIAVQNVFSRYIFSLGRAGLITPWLSKMNKRKSPRTAAITVAVVIIVLLAAFLLTGTDPFTLYSWMLGVGTAGFIVVLTIASIAVIAFFRKPENKPSNVWATLIAPIVAGLGTLGVLYLVITNYEYVGGEGVTAWILLLSIPVLALVGLILALNRPKVDFSDVIES